MDARTPTTPRYITENWKFFPCVAWADDDAAKPAEKRGKRPLTPNGLHDATNNPDVIAAWREQFQNCNWAIPAEANGLSIVDLDGPEAEGEWFDLQLDHGQVPDTYTVITPRGRHLYFKGSIKNTTSAIAPGIDTRGVGGYCMAPGSFVNGVTYTEENPDAPIADLPAWVATLTGRSRERTGAAKGVVLDTPSSIGRARVLLAGYVSSGHVALEGKGGDDCTYAVAAEVLNLGLSVDKAEEVLQPWNNACLPPWSADELRVKIENASRYAQNEVGAWAVPPTVDRIPKEALDKLLADSVIEAEAPQEQIEHTEEARLSEKFRVIRSSDFHKLKPAVYVVQNLIGDMNVGLIYAPWGAFKTFVLIDLLGGIAANVKVFGKYAINKVGPTLLAAAEQPNAAAHQRFPAWCKKNGLSVPDVPFHLTRNVPLVQNPKEVIAFVKSVKREKLELVAIGIDTLTRAMGGLDLNAPQAAGMMTNAADYIRDELGCAVIMTGHMGKDKSKKSFGSNLIPANCDFVFEIDRPLPKGPAIIFKNEKMKDDDTNPDLFLCGEKFANSLVLNLITEGEYKRLIATGGPGEAQALTAEIVAVLRASGFVGGNMCGTKELLNLILAERGELENDPKVDDKARDRLRSRIRVLQEKGDETLLALGRKAPGKTAGRQWSAPAPIGDDDGDGYLGSLEDV